jgi:hypothetical protein
MRYRREGCEIVAVEDQARDLVFVIRNKLVVQEGFERKVGQRHLGGDVLDRALCRDAGQRIARARRRGFGEALARRVLRSGKPQRTPLIVVW